MEKDLNFSSQEKKLLKKAYLLAKSRRSKLYLVGGALRDKITGRKKESPDFDFCLKTGAINFARALAKKLKAGFVVLDSERGVSRVVRKEAGTIYTFDFTDFRGPTLEDDLLHRDFTINSLALKLEDIFFSEDISDSLIDRFNTRDDLKNKVIRMNNGDVFKEDPLRILRAFSFACILGFKIEQNTLKAAKRERSKLSGVSGERLRDELFKVFGGAKTCDYLKKMDELGILEVIFPEIKKMRGIGQGPYHHLDVWQHTLESVKQLEEIYLEFKNKDIQAYLNEEISSERRRYALLKFGAFLHDIGKPAALRHIKGKTIFHGHERMGLNLTGEIIKRLKLSNDEAKALFKMVLWHLRPGYLADSENPSERAKFRYFRDAGREALGILLLSLADQRATKGPLTTNAARLQHERVVARLIREYLRKSKEKKKPRLVNGDDIMKRFKLKPSVLIGKVLAQIEELQAIGKISSKQEALKEAAKLIRK